MYSLLTVYHLWDNVYLNATLIFESGFYYRIAAFLPIFWTLSPSQKYKLFFLPK